MWLVGDIFRTAWIFYQGVVHHPDCWNMVLFYLFLVKGAWFNTFNTCLLSSWPRTIMTAWGWDTLIEITLILGYLVCLLGASLVLHVFHLLDYSSWFSWGSAQSIMVIWGHACLGCPRLYLARLLSVFLGAPWHTDLIEYLLGLLKALS